MLAKMAHDVPKSSARAHKGPKSVKVNIWAKMVHNQHGNLPPPNWPKMGPNLAPELKKGQNWSESRLGTPRNGPWPESSLGTQYMGYLKWPISSLGTPSN